MFEKYERGILPKKAVGTQREERRLDTRAASAKAAEEANKKDLAQRIKQFQFREIRAKSASEISDIKVANELLGHTEEEITGRVYRRVGQAVTPTR